MRKWLLLILILVHPSLLMAQSQFGNDFVLSGATCPPVNTPAHTGTLYTCTGTGALYTWTGSAWVLTGGGSGTLTGTLATTQVAFGSGANAITGSADLTYVAAGETNLRHAAIGNSSALNGGTIWGETDKIGLDLETTFTTDDSANGYYLGGFSGIEVGFPANSMSIVYGFYSNAQTAVGNNKNLPWIIANEGFASHKGTGDLDNLVSYNAYLSTENGGNVGNAMFFWGNTISPSPGPGDIATLYGIYFNALGGYATNTYSFWSDEAGVYRIRSDNTFNSVYQGIAALYNPQFTKYTPGAANFERCIPGCQWESNVAVLTTEAGAGGGNVLRSMRIGDTGVSVEYGSILNGTAIKGDTTSGDTYLFQVYDNNTGPAQVTWMTATNGNTPSVVIAPPTGGTTISVSANAFATSSTTAVAVANVGANSCGTSAASIAGNDNVGAITVGATSATQCRITFTVASTTRRHCVATDETTAGVAATLHTAYVDSTHTDILGTITAADVISYVCFAR
jgi:hypothetical protein